MREYDYLSSLGSGVGIVEKACMGIHQTFLAFAVSHLVLAVLLAAHRYQGHASLSCSAAAAEREDTSNRIHRNSRDKLLPSCQAHACTSSIEAS